MPQSIEELESRRNDAIERMETAASAIEQAGESDDLDALRDALSERETEVEDIDRAIEAQQAAKRAREQHVVRDVTPAERVEVGREEPVYRPDVQHSFFGDLIRARMDDSEAGERIARHREMTKRDVTAAAGAAGVVPPSYLKELWAPKEAYGRPFISSLPRFPFPQTGTSHTIPYTATSPSAAVQATENTALSETDADIDTQTYYTAYHAGIQDFSIQAYQLTDPAFDSIVMSELVARRWEAQEGDAFTGAGTARLYLGLDNVSSIQTVTYTDGTPDQLTALKQIYNGAQKVASNLYEPADCIVVHPRRAGWFAAGSSSETPLLQQGVYMQAFGAQDEAVMGILGGLPVISSPAITTTAGSGTNEDAIYVVAKRKMYFAEDEVMAQVFESPGSATGTVRVRLGGFSLLIAGRYANAICKISGTGLVTPTFT